jgi:hypothetical protein
MIYFIKRNDLLVLLTNPIFAYASLNKNNNYIYFLKKNCYIIKKIKDKNIFYIKEI